MLDAGIDDQIRTLIPVIPRYRQQGRLLLLCPDSWLRIDAVATAAAAAAPR